MHDNLITVNKKREKMKGKAVWLAGYKDSEWIGIPAILDSDLADQIEESGMAKYLENGETLLMYSGAYYKAQEGAKWCEFDPSNEFDPEIWEESKSSVREHKLTSETIQAYILDKARVEVFSQWNDCYQAVKKTFGTPEQFRDLFSEKLGKTIKEQHLDWGFKDDDSRYEDVSYTFYVYKESHLLNDCDRKFFSMFGEKIKDKVAALLPSNSYAQKRSSWGS